jgi:hypothetical protein
VSIKTDEIRFKQRIKKNKAQFEQAEDQLSVHARQGERRDLLFVSSEPSSLPRKHNIICAHIHEERVDEGVS